MPTDSRLVYSTGTGRIIYCRRCHQPEDSCRCRTAGSATDRNERKGRSEGTVYISLDRKGRAGKPGTLLLGLPADEALLSDLCRSLKKLCGSGGTSKQGEIFIQGDHRDVIEKRLAELGYRTRRSGG